MLVNSYATRKGCNCDFFFFLLEEESYCLPLEISIITFYDIFNWKHFHTGTSPSSGSWKAGCKHERCWIMAFLPPAYHFPSSAVPAGTGWGRIGRDSLDGEHQPLHQCCPHLRGRTIPHTHRAPSLSQLFEMPPNQQSLSVANIAM